MRVDDKVWSYSLSGEWQVLLSVGHATSSFLSMSAGELVTDLRDSLRSHLDLCKPKTLFIDCENYLIYLSSL